jgi:NAD(P)-dependent dehydrogenase (short-subunit alcohol dehydrogenase family)
MAPSTNWEFPPYTKTIHRSQYPAIDPKNPSNSVSGKVVVVTGGGSGVGKGISQAFVEAGARAVIILGRRQNVLQEAKADLEKSGSSKVLTIQADVADEAALNTAFEKIEKEFGKVDIVVGNAAYLPHASPAATSDVADWWKGFEVNIKGTLLLFRAFMAHKSDNSPTFISLNTGAAHAGVFPTMSGYAASKTGQAMLITYLQAENPDVRIVSMHPGVIETEMNIKSGMPLSRDDMSLPSGFAVWLASPAAQWTAGRYLWAHWDVDELEKMKDEITAKDELSLGLKGWPREVSEPVIVA